MGTGRPHVEITAATLAGGDNNQDRYAYGDGWAFVLDGASSFTSEQPEHDGGWYAEHLKLALSAGLTGHPERTTRAIVENAIREVAELHGDSADSCPTSTIALARWDDEKVEAYLLGDSTIAFISPEGEEVLSDARLANIAQPIRDRYRSRLRAGRGFDGHHRELLQELQGEQAAARNQQNGYWIAGVDPESAHHALAHTRPLATIHTAILATDGAAAGIHYGVSPSWKAMADQGTHEALSSIHEMENADPHASQWPRSKAHDDKTAIIIRFTYRSVGDGE